MSPVSVPVDGKRLRGDISLDDLVEALQAIRRGFGEDWLCQSGGRNPLQNAWRSPEWLATVQLGNLGHSLSKLVSLDSKWLKETLKSAKANECNRARGAVFELFVVGALRRNLGEMAEPASPGQKAFDATLKFKDNAMLRVSLKSFGPSSHEREFKAKMGGVRGRIRRRFRPGGTQILITASEPIVSQGQWSLLEQSLTRMLDEYQGFALKESGSWRIAVAPLRNPRLSKLRASDTFMAFAPFHPNERANVFAKLEDAISAFRKHKFEESDQVRNIVIAQVSMGLDIAACSGFVREYFRQHPEVPCSAAFLVQPNLNEGRHETTFLLVSGEVFNSEAAGVAKFFSNPHRAFALPILSGTQSRLSPRITFMGDGGILPGRIEDTYVYRDGDHFLEVPWDGRSPLSASLEQIAGIRPHLIISAPGKAFELQLKHVRDYDLRLLFVDEDPS